MKGLLALSWKHARFHYVRTVLLVLSLGLGFSIPLAARVVTSGLQEMLTRRARSTPMILGSPGSRIDLVLGGLYFRAEGLRTLSYGLFEKNSQDELIDAVPLHLLHHAKSYPVVGTSIDYFSKRNLVVEFGTMPLRLGDCLIGSAVARELNLQPGDRILSDAKGFLNPVGDLPLKMRITGILSPSQSPDDHALFVDIKTAWLMDGIAHGHIEQAKAGKEQILNRNDQSVTLGANVENYMEVTDENLSSFHFHGEKSTFPLTAILIFPAEEKNGIIWEGRYQNDKTVLITHPLEVVQELIATLVNIRHLVDAVVVILGVVMIALLLLSGSLSLQLRKQEMETFHALGASRAIRAKLIALDFLIIFTLSLPVTILLSWTLSKLGKPLLFQLLL